MPMAFSITVVTKCSGKMFSTACESQGSWPSNIPCHCLHQKHRWLCRVYSVSFDFFDERVTKHESQRREKGSGIEESIQGKESWMHLKKLLFFLYMTWISWLGEKRRRQNIMLCCSSSCLHFLRSFASRFCIIFATYSPFDTLLWWLSSYAFHARRSSVVRNHSMPCLDLMQPHQSSTLFFPSYSLCPLLRCEFFRAFLSSLHLLRSFNERAKEMTTSLNISSWLFDRLSESYSGSP